MSRTLVKTGTLADYLKEAKPIHFPMEVNIDKQIAALEAKIATLHPVARQHAEELQAMILELKLSKIGIYETLPLEPLKWRRADGFPVFGLFDIAGDSVFSFQLDSRSREGLIPIHRFLGARGAPTVIDDCFADLEVLMRKRIPRWFFNLLPQDKDVMLSTRFAGIIPSEATAKIKQTEGLFFKTYVIAEATEWEFTVTPAPRPILRHDPLVVGFQHNKLYLITAFDPTTPEQIWVESAMTGS